jgi:hypothetical protein
VDKEPRGNNCVGVPAGSMGNEPDCKHRVVTPPKRANLCQLGRFGGLVTDGMCRRCIKDGLSSGEASEATNREVGASDGDRLVVDELHPAYPRAKPGLGDMVKATLSAVGITEERVSKAIGKPCGCGKRAAKLNELGHKYLGLPPGQSSAG